MILLRSVAFRGALWITLIALLTTSFALTIQYLGTARLLDQRMEVALVDEMSGLLGRYRSGGIAAVAELIEREQRRPRYNGFIYVLADAGGDVLVGDLPEVPPGASAPGRGSFELQIGTPSRRLWLSRVDTLTIAVGDRYRLLVGRIAEDRADLRKQYVRAMLWSLLLTAGLGLLLGWWFSQRSLAFVGDVSEAGRRFLRGRWEERIPVSPNDDEYDRLAQMVNACFEEMEHVVRSLRAATDGMAHDLKTPLTRLRSRLELAEMRGADEAQLRQVVEASRRDLDAILRIITGVLEVAKAEAATAENFATVDLSEVVREVLELYEPVAEARSIRFESQLGCGRVHGSRSLLGQMVANLIDNAVKFSPDGAVVNIKVRSSAEGTILCVADSGPGIPSERREDVLARFVRLDDSRSTEGTGLGLSIVNAVARVHRARLELADNQPGLRVTISFPAAPLEA